MTVSMASFIAKSLLLCLMLYLNDCSTCPGDNFHFLIIFFYSPLIFQFSIMSCTIGFPAIITLTFFFLNFYCSSVSASFILACIRQYITGSIRIDRYFGQYLSLNDLNYLDLSISQSTDQFIYLFFLLYLN